MGSKGTRGLGITGLFAGDSGTGKTMSAEVVAHDLGFDVYVIDLSTVVDKYIGETEKNLDRIFTEADRVNGVLLFDEADALFGKRSEVKDARDRYANVEVAYLLQRMERFDGLAILTTNLRSNVDEAFVRRLDAIVDFPMPEEEHRLRLWARQPAAGPAAKPTTSTSTSSPASSRSRGGNIRNICVTAAYLAAAGGPPGRDDGPRPGDRARVPQARPPDGRSRVRGVPGARDELRRLLPVRALPGSRRQADAAQRSGGVDARVRSRSTHPDHPPEIAEPVRGRRRPSAGAANVPPRALDAASVLHLQRTAGNASVVQLLAADDEERSPVHEMIGSGGGQPLDRSTRSSMEEAFGQSFDDVRVHTEIARLAICRVGRRERLHGGLRHRLPLRPRAWQPDVPARHRARAGARPPAACRAGRRHRRGRRDPRLRPVGPVRAGGRGARDPDHGRAKLELDCRCRAAGRRPAGDRGRRGGRVRAAVHERRPRRRRGRDWRERRVRRQAPATTEPRPRSSVPIGVGRAPRGAVPDEAIELPAGRAAGHAASRARDGTLGTPIR